MEQTLRANTPDLDAPAKEAVLVALFREGQLTHKQFAQTLGLDRWQAEAVLKKHNVIEDLPTIDEVREQVRLSGNLRTHH